MRIAEHLHLDVPWTVDPGLQQHPVVAERRLGLASSGRQRRVEGFRAIDLAHALAAAAAARLGLEAKPASPWSALTGFRVNSAAVRSVRLELDGQVVVAETGQEAPRLSTIVSPPHVVVFEAGDAFDFTDPKPAAAQEAAVGDGAIRSPMPGKVVSVAVAPGAQVAKGAALVTLEAMKMEHALVAPFDGVVVEVKAEAGDQVAEGVLLVRLEKSEP